MIARVAAFLAALAFAGAGFAEGGIVAKNAWMRPAPAGAEAARVYVDITSDAPVELVGASSTAAKSVAIVTVATIGDPSTEAVVKTFPVPAGSTTRFAYRGNHLRFVDLTRSVGNGDDVKLTLTFRDKAGKRTSVVTDVTVRGLLMPQQVPEAARDAPVKPPAS